MTYAAAGRHHYNFQTSDEIASLPLFPSLIAPASPSTSEESLLGRAWTKRTHPDRAVLLLSLSVEVEAEVPDRLGSRLTYCMHAVSNGRMWSNGTKYPSTVAVLSLRPSRGVRNPEATESAVNRSLSMLPTLRTRQKLIQPPEELGQAENIWTLCMKFPSHLVILK